ncbi:hypothetical protein B1B04_13060 [Lysinibacillus sp. KCTC 33748]|uniref:hypothetical protein n=1 Tax=unclassified Lysinibacillus TaxID=2636778 RepID=UPI0009A70A99|nr:MULTISPECIES: hypothetical protein [unclassified Lysinibacillus]OXS73211.1 hypothetical protein B1B04_13060 [Lysinibacillus sp. KCTC 33748]SKB82664.1 hypothetical protein SAMN06295926_10967 [Lysinibacillus sp. AC-3]
MTGNVSYENLSDSLKQKLTESNVDIVNDLITGGADKALSAEMGKVLNDKNPEYGVERINANHAIRRFPVFNDWANNTNRELLRFQFPDTMMVGRITVRYSSKIYVTNNGGTAEIQYDVARRNVGQTGVNATSNLIDITKDFANMFYVINGLSSPNTDFKPYFTLVKRSEKTPLYIEVEYLTNYPHNAGDILEQMELLLVSTDNAPANPASHPFQIGALEKAKDAITRSIGGGTYYINPTTGDDFTGEVGNTAKKFKTIQAALDKIPKFLDGNYMIILDKGTYNEYVRIDGFVGSSEIEIRGASTKAESVGYKLMGVHMRGCVVKITLYGINFYGGNNLPISAKRCSHVQCSASIMPDSSIYSGVVAEASFVNISSCTIANKVNAIEASDMSTVYVGYCDGSGNNTVFKASWGATIVKNSVSITGSQNENILNGGLVR